ncbi:MAG: histidine kinase dimerization/phospho-acceptor domain-containing protein, partial [bacterium]
MKSNRIRIIIILGTIAMSGIIVFQVFWFTKTWTLKEKQFDQTVHYALNKVAHEIYKYNNMEPPGYNPVNLIHPGYYIVNIKSEIDVNVLEYYLKREFDNFHIIVDFEYGVYDCRTDKMLYGDYVCATENCQKSFSNKLPTYDEFTYYFGVNFPTVDRYLLSEMSVWTIFSTLLLLVILFFSYTLYIIFKQKRLSEQQREFINNMTHEFKTPISTINIAVDVLLNPEFMKDRNKVIDYAKIIKQENNRLNSQVERVLGM